MREIRVLARFAALGGEGHGAGFFVDRFDVFGDEFS